jgi:tRNA dimethylallyltransferase
MIKNIFIVGPTGSGKSRLAFNLCNILKGCILNVDSCQIYNDLQILTAQPSEQEKNTVPHFLYNFHPLTKGYNVSLYMNDVNKCLKTLQNSTPKVFVGGTGLYVKALTEGFVTSSISPIYREKTHTLYKQHGISPLYEALKKKDLNFSLHHNDHQRILRAYELYLAEDDPKSITQIMRPLCANSFIIYVDPCADELRKIIKHRIDQMIETGALAEVKKTVPIYSSLGSTAEKIIGLKELSSYLLGELSLDEAKEKMYYRTCQYAKRQRTWFRHQISENLCFTEPVSEKNSFTFTEKILDQLTDL